MDEILSKELESTELPPENSREAEEKTPEIPDISEADFAPRKNELPFVYEEYEEPQFSEKTESGDVKQEKDLTSLLLTSFDEMKGELIEPYEHKRSITRRIFSSRRSSRELDLTFYVKNAGNFLGFFFGLAVARILHGNMLMYCILSINFSFAMGFLKHYYVDKYPLKQSLRMNLAFTSVIIAVMGIVWLRILSD